ncbi:MAG: type II toxin-antitoxin system HipA family toxin [Puniceicoccaceae bacterium]|nr:MAG: type II toxin-antitoxin system HipA family toxin [Puniceicoccaceae bacterium]
MKTLQVHLLGELVGILEQTPTGRIDFRYTEDWLQQEGAQPLSQSLPLEARVFEERECVGFFGGLLPEAHNREIIARNLGISARNDFAMLREIGGECAGAVSLHEVDTLELSSVRNYQFVSESVLADLLDQLPQRPLLAGQGEIRLSLAGAQNKLALYQGAEGFALPLHESPSTHILKPEIERFPDLVENEAYCLQLAGACGLPTSQAERVRVGKHRCLLVERYDRSVDEQGDILRLHQEDFCQALGIPSRIKYQNEGGPGLSDCFDLVRRSASSPGRVLMYLYHGVVFNYLIGNNDAHGKNFSLLYREVGGGDVVDLAPFYDLVSTASYPELSPKMAMKIGSQYLPYKLRAHDWEQLWESIGFSKKQARKQTLQFAEVVEANSGNSDGEAEATIGRLIQQRIQDLREMLA